MAVRRLSGGTISVASLLRWLLLGATLQTAATARNGFDANFGRPVHGLLLYRSAEGPARPCCTFLSTRFRLPPLYQQEDVSRGVEFRYANRSCQLELASASAKHVFLIVPVNDTACPFEDSLAQAVSAKAYSLIVACDIERKVHLTYFTSGENYTVPVQDIIVGLIRHDIVEAFKPKNAEVPATSATNVSYSGGDTAQLYVLEASTIIGASLIWLMACTTVAMGALWSGSTRKLLYLTQHRRTEPKGKQQREEDAALSRTSLGPDSTTSRPAWATSTKEHSKSQHHHHDARARSSSKCADDFPISDNETLNEEIAFAECPVGCKLLTLFVLMLAVNLLVLYYFFNKLWPLLVGCIALGSAMSLIVIFNSLAFLIPCAGMRMPNVLFPCFVQSMEIRHHVAIWCAISVTLVWVVFRKAHHAWILQNFLGSSFALNILRCVHLPNFKIITFISILIFFDDIFMVFITSLISKDVSVMESVARGVQDLPVLMRVPLFFTGDATVCRANSMMLGYGDIAIPGFAIAYCRYYDVIVKNRPWYFLLAITCYGASLVFTFFMGHLMNTGQPALLYLVPGVLLPTILLAWYRGDLNNFWNGEFVPKKGLMSSHQDVCVSSSEQFQMIQGRGLLYVTTPLFAWLAVPLPVSQKAYDAK
ncbi:signal peptide peptidase-like 2C [Dermacentor albipictus]|uniref:signal peptide peptidase-like 2C n=1 Tax=Dermacentor albipictus TaxID=60249 RepID=UPI0031FCE603